MKKIMVIFLVLMTLGAPTPARCDIFGGDVAVLVQILANAYQQLSQLQSILGSGKDSLGLLRTINQGMNDSLTLMRTVSPNTNPGLYSNWQNPDQSKRAVQNIYGTPPRSPESQVQQDADQSVAEAVSLNNSIYNYTNEIDAIGEQVKAYSHSASPGGAQKLTAETLGVILHVLNQSLRAQATGLKLQAQEIAIQNHKDKENTRQMIADSDSLNVAMKSEPVNFSIPRF
jgi:hypothetical protein